MNGLMIMLRLKPVLAMQTMALLWADLTWPLHMIKVGLSPFNLSASRPALKSVLQAFLVPAMLLLRHTLTAMPCTCGNMACYTGLLCCMAYSTYALGYHWHTARYSLFTQ